MIDGKQHNEIIRGKKNAFSFWLVFSLILNGYASGLPGLSLGSVVLIALVIISFFQQINRGKMLANIVMAFGLIITVTSLIGFCLISLFQSQLNVAFSSGLVGFAKFWLWVLMASIVVYENYDFESLLKWLYRFAILLTVYMVIQNIAFYAAGMYLPNIFHIGPLQPYAEEYANYERLASVRILRAGSLLSESSFYGNFIICTLALYLDKYISELRGKRLYAVIFMAFGVVLSGSTSAIIIVAGMFLLFYRRVNSSKKWQIVFLAFAGVIVVIVAWPQLISSSLGSSLEYSFGKFSYLDSSTRFGKSFSYLGLFPSISKIFGVGIGFDYSITKLLSGNDSIYLNSVTSLIIQSGFVGLMLFGVFSARLFMKAVRIKSLSAACLIIAYVIKGFASGIYFSTYGALFMFLIIGQLMMGEQWRYEKK